MSGKCFDYKILRDGEDKVLHVDMDACTVPASVEDSKITMAKVVEFLMENSGVTRIVLSQKREYEYDYTQTMFLVEIANIASLLAKDDRLSYPGSVSQSGCDQFIRTGFLRLQYILFSILKGDPITAFVELVRLNREESIKEAATLSSKGVACFKHEQEIISYVIELLERTKLINVVKTKLAGHQPGDRTLYRSFFHPSSKPDFLFAKVMAAYPPEGKVLDSYKVGNAEVTIFGFKDDVKTLYHVVPPEFNYSEDKYDVLDVAKRILSEHKPTRDEFINPERMREVFLNVGRNLLEELLVSRRLKLSVKEVEEMAQVLLRYTVGFGLIEVILSDPKVQDISINSPLGTAPLFIVHQDFDDCYTNVIPTLLEAESWATKLRLVSGRPLDEANPILDTEIEISGIRSRVAAVTSPLNPRDYAFSFRRHRDKPWTLPLFMHVNMINDIAAGLLSFIIDGTRTMLIAGTRSSGKTSLLSSCLVEIMRRYRIITIEDTLELPVRQLGSLGFNIQSLKVASALTSKESPEVEASTGIRSTLRLGDSALIVGEVRSDEAIALYEAMRVGAAANVVAGTIHAASPYGVFDRVVNDIGVPRTSFKATDLIVVANPIRIGAGLRRQRRVLQITEVRKRWEADPSRENGFVDLLKYNPDTDQLEITDALINGDSDILKEIGGNNKEFAGSWDAIWENITLRAKIKRALVDLANSSNNLELLEAPFVIKANDAFHIISDKVKKEVGRLDSKRILFDFNEWLKREVKRHGREGASEEV